MHGKIREQHYCIFYSDYKTSISFITATNHFDVVPHLEVFLKFLSCEL